MHMSYMIEKKRDGLSLTKKEIEYVIDAYTNGSIPDYQMSAFLMAIYFQGMTDEECASLTMAMAKSGETIDLSAIDGIKVDKHSTGGVGDKTTLVLIPLIASIGVPVGKMSGRGLGHTGGTLDKLESIPGFQIEVSTQKFMHLMKQNNMAVIGQSRDLAPADKNIYRLRDVTATVDSIPLIASSIMSKKIASGADAFVLDIKMGSGAFMNKLTTAKQLAQSMVAIGQRVGKKTVAVISNMDQPLGNAIGNALEVKEAIETLKGNGPDDLTKLCLILGSHMAVLANKADNFQEAKERLQEHLYNGKALECFKTLLRSQGGNPEVVDQLRLLPQSEHTFSLEARTSGVIEHMDAHNIGTAVMKLGAGRKTTDDIIDPSVGVILHKKVGDAVQVGDPLMSIHTNKTSIQTVQEQLLTSIHMTKDSKDIVNEQPLIYETIQYS